MAMASLAEAVTRTVTKSPESARVPGAPDPRTATSYTANAATTKNVLVGATKNYKSNHDAGKCPSVRLGVDSQK